MVFKKSYVHFSFELFLTDFVTSISFVYESEDLFDLLQGDIEVGSVGLVLEKVEV